MRHRLSVFLFIGFLLVFLLVTRLFFLQIVNGEYYSELAVSQRELGITVKQNRGMIYDKEMIPFLNREDEYYAVIETALLENRGETSRFLADYMDKNAIQIENRIMSSKFNVFPLTELPEVERQGVGFLSIPKRYGNTMLAHHVIGYINKVDNNGVSGIERAFNDVLKHENSQKISMIGNGSRTAIGGLGYQVTDADINMTGVKLTLDYKIQRITEEAMASVEKGAAVVVDTQNGDIAAMVSRPDFDPNNVAAYTKSKNGELTNRALMAYNAGSVFKIVVSAACLEEDQSLFQKRYYCGGYSDVYDHKISCHKAEGHGDQSFAEGFANSCNPAFIQAGMSIGAGKITEMAKRFGLGEAIPVYEGSNEASGNIPVKETYYPVETANISLGQGEILVTPVQVADMVCTIANGGVRKKLNLVDSLVDENGNVQQVIRKDQEHRVIPTFIAQRIASMMRGVTEFGTGTLGNVPGYGNSAGKTGSAEAGYHEDGTQKVHAWFAGYFPYDTPRYAIVIFVEDGKSGAYASAPVFKQIAEGIGSLYLR